jgi:UDP-2-acetamido-3-amino-2,3-dideoxy-glucuronate N-acetyltransferase
MEEPRSPVEPSCYVHPSAYVDEPCAIGPGTRIWHFCHVMPHARIGRGCTLGQNVHVASGVTIGNNVKIQNNVSLYEGCVVEDDVFLGPSCVFTNISNPRSEVVRRHQYVATRVRRGATIGANATIVCGTTVGRFAFIAAGAVVTRDVPDYALMMGVPARQAGWMSRHGYRLGPADAAAVRRCPKTGLRYREEPPGKLHCLDLDESAPLPRSNGWQITAAGEGEAPAEPTRPLPGSARQEPRSPG